MKTPSDTQLSSELQELYLQNKQWLSDVLFLEDETRFFSKIFDHVLSSTIKESHFQEVQFINASLCELEERRDDLKKLVIHHQQLLESLLVDSNKAIGLNLIEENTEIMNNINVLFATDKSVKKKLYSLVEGVIQDHKAGNLLN